VFGVVLFHTPRTVGAVMLGTEVGQVMVGVPWKTKSHRIRSPGAASGTSEVVMDGLLWVVDDVVLRWVLAALT
jgi:hypothetical protein